MAHVTARVLASVAALTTILPLAADTHSGVISASVNSTIATSGGTAESHQKLEETLRTFQDAGLALPDLVVRFSDDEADCGGHDGRFRDSTTPWEISICSNGDAVYLHELAHAWERANLSDDQRAAFMELRGYEVWSSAEVPWNQRGVEGVAFVIQQGLADVPLSPALSNEAQSRMQAYELLTGTPAPRLVRWLADRTVDCPTRPTILSLEIADATGATCGVQP